MASLLEEMLADSPSMLLRGNESSGTTASDSSSGGGNDGTLQTGASFGGTALVASDTSIVLDGSTGYITVPTGAWIDRSDGAWTFAIVVARDVVEDGELFDKGATSAAAMRFGFDTGGQWLSAGHSGGSVHTYSSVANDTSRHMYVATYDGTTHKLYEDGVSIEDSSDNPTYSNSTNDLTIGAAAGGSTLNLDGRIAYMAYFPTAIGSTRIATWWSSIDNTADAGPVWTTPANSVSMSVTPELKFTSPSSSVKQHFQLQLDTANTFDTGNLRTYDSSVTQTNWTYWNGSAWTAMPSDGLPIAYSGNEVCYTVTATLSSATWYRRVRAGTLT